MSCPARLAFRRLRGGANPPMKAVGGPERAGSNGRADITHHVAMVA